MDFPRSCDTFVVLPPLTKGNLVIFGKNSDRPQNEVQEVILVKDRILGTKLKCTYITIDESVDPINSVMLSKPAWMWGAEMGANNKNVVIGNEAVWTNNNDGEGDARVKRLLGMDLVRLGLERGNSAEEALNVITDLLGKYGQGGPCSECDDSHFYHNTFLIADTKEAWVLETSGKIWAAEKIENSYRNISNGLTITTKIDKHSTDLYNDAKQMGVWDGKSEFNFSAAFSSGGDEMRWAHGKRLLGELSKDKSFDVKRMFRVLRDKASCICRGVDDMFPTQGSQVSSLSPHGVTVHWFTATPDPSVSYFKPFVFTADAVASPFTASPNEAKREHYLYRLHSANMTRSNDMKIPKLLRELEEACLSEIDDLVELDSLFKNCVETEVNLYGYKYNEDEKAMMLISKSI
ncbi:secernin-3 [Leptidea sinapis]|uniref:secernin-3 n=1 Tax=Leptidea sinapis TaxID=189913 RepID=UPI00212F9EA1|nr:secernin-3 [Leptidea sinapis]XP_050683656.1 secernin-3 [Leptidea sinapis]